jgi:hypothetical protein
MFDRTASKPTKPAAEAVPASEDKRRPKQVVSYALLWLCAVVCVVFALIALLVQG